MGTMAGLLSAPLGTTGQESQLTKLIGACQSEVFYPIKTVTLIAEFPVKRNLNLEADFFPSSHHHFLSLSRTHRPQSSCILRALPMVVAELMKKH